MSTQENTTAYPLSYPHGWPRTPRANIKRSNFGTRQKPITTDRAIKALALELKRLNATDVVISTNLRLRNDGYPMSSQRDPDDRGAAVYFKLKGKPRVLACDKWLLVGENLYAIARHIEALRAQERWGVGTLDQAFTGYAALPATTGEHWTSVLGLTRAATRDEVNQQFLKIVRERNAHPDVGGSRAEFDKLTTAREQAWHELEMEHDINY